MKYLKLIAKIIAYIIGIYLFIGLVLPITISPVYNFPEPKVFSGDKIYNPYKNIEFKRKNWLKGNFQVQSRAWGGITDGEQNTNDKVLARYQDLKYDIIGISDYQKINYSNKDDSLFIPIYEHGYNVKKTHQVLIGSNKVLWFEYPLYQTLDNKQFILDLLRDDNKIIALAHPQFSLVGYSTEDVKYLTNYDLLEALNHQRFSFPQWDSALSAGKISYILADDDTHDIDNPYLVGRLGTMIYCENPSADNVIKVLKQGKTYGYSVYTPNNDTFEGKMKRLKDFHYLHYLKLENDTIKIKVDETPKKIVFIGQGGEIKKTVKNSSETSYKFKENDTYIRTEVYYRANDEDAMFLNPVFRYSGEKPVKEIAIINWTKTILYRGLAILVIFTIMFFIIKRFFIKSK